VSGFLALRLIVLRQALRATRRGSSQTEGWCASAELVARLAPHARRLDAVPAAARYDLVQRPSRVSRGASCSRRGGPVRSSARLAPRWPCS